MAEKKSATKNSPAKKKAATKAAIKKKAMQNRPAVEAAPVIVKRTESQGFKIPMPPRWLAILSFAFCVLYSVYLVVSMIMLLVSAVSTSTYITSVFAVMITWLLLAFFLGAIPARILYSHIWKG